MKQIIDKIFVKFGIDSSDLKKGAEEAGISLDKLMKKTENTGETINNAFDGKTKKGQKGKSKNSNKSTLQQFIGDLKQSTNYTNILSNSILNLGKSLGKAFEIASPFALIYGGLEAAGMVRNIANANTPYYFASQRTNTSVGQLSGFGQALATIGGNPSDIVNALGIIGASQTQTRFTGNSAMNPYLNALGVPIAKNGIERKPLDILLDISKNLTQDVKNKRLSRQDAYNLLAMMGFSSDVSNFIMQGRRNILQEFRNQTQNIGVLTKQQVMDFKAVTVASANETNAMKNLTRNIADKLSPATVKFYNLLTRLINDTNYLINHPKKGAILAAKDAAKFAASTLLPITVGGSNALTRSNYKNLLGSLSYSDSRSLNNLIKGGESAGNYGAYNTGTNYAGYIGHSGYNANISKMTLGQIMAWQAKTKHASYMDPNRLFAVGAYQLTPTTLGSVAKRLKLNSNAIFNKALQDKIANYLIMQDAGSYLTGKTNNSAQAIANLRRDWTSLQSIKSSQISASLNKTRAQYTHKNITNNNIAAVHIHTNATDGSRIAQDFVKNLSFQTPLNANYGTR